MHNLTVDFYKKPGHENDTATIDGIFEYDHNDSEKLIIKVNQMNGKITKLEKSLGELQAKIKAYQDILLKYESVFREEISLYRLQKSKLTTMQEAFHSQELFTKEIEHHISSYMTNSPQQNNNCSTFKRIILRFFHQNRLNQSNANLKISEIEELINKKQQLLERLQTDVKDWKKQASSAISPSKSQQIALN